MFKPVNPKPNFRELEEKILEFWEKNKIFEKSVARNKGRKNFVFYEGPPTANGQPGSHHVLARVFKDLVPRYKNMKGYYCERKGGWDCHGLPVELEIEKKLRISGKPEIEKYGVEKFNQLCRESVFEYVSDWEKLTKRIGFWIDMRDSYQTLTNKYIETCWWILKEIWGKGWLYEDYKVVPYCPRCGTSLSSHELALGYKDNVKDPSLYIKFKVKGKDNTYFLAWTTTPWTLPGNLALAVDKKAEYVGVEVDGEYLILAKARLSVIAEAPVMKKYLGKDLVGLEYEPLYKFINYDKKAHYVVPADFVSLSEGTGIVHTAVMYGEEDFELGKKFDLPKKHLVNERGEFIKEVTPWQGMFVKEADSLIIEDLEKRGLLYKKETILHTYPFCWRCDTPLLYYAVHSWYLRTTAVKKRLFKNNNSVNWVPSHIKKGRMGEWLESNRDWALSRSRFWGTPLPVWRCPSCQKIKVVGSVKELSELTGKNLDNLDLHRPYLDELSFKCDCGGEFVRVSYVLDCWFDSGAMPFAQWHYPFENKDKFAKNFPADYICEAIDQTRGWFYTLAAVSALLEKESPYKNVICLGHALDEKGEKMSKSKGNVVDPWSVINNVSADAMRWYFYSVISSGESFRFSVGLVKEVTRRFLLVLWNVYNFFVTYANLDKVESKKARVKSNNILDQWIIASLSELIEKVTSRLDNYDIYGATSDIESFVSDLSTWYIRRSRDRIGPTANNKDDKEQFYYTCYYMLVTLSKILAPFTPFIAEEMFKNLTGKESVHLEEWPKTDNRKQITDNKKLLGNMEMVRKICELGHAKRKRLGIKVRQPLKKLTIRHAQYAINNDYLYLIKDELNVKDIEFVKGKGDLKVEFDTKMTLALRAEGQARELVRAIQEERKELGCALDEMVKVELSDWPESFTDFIKRKTLTKELVRGSRLKVIRSR